MVFAYVCDDCGERYEIAPGVTIRCPECGSKERSELTDDLERRFNLLSEAFGMLEVAASELVGLLGQSPAAAALGRVLGQAKTRADEALRPRRE